MAKVFRLYKGNNNIQGWGTSVQYGEHAISQIEDPNAADVKKEITSIPSPFARIDLVKNAYKEVVKSGNLHGNTIFHKMVSDSLDIAQIFFNLPKLQDRVKVLVWDVQQELNNLCNNASSEQKRVGKTLNMFLKQDAQSYNFEHLNCVYLLHYFGQHRKTQLDIIGATSPATLFFSSANDFSYLSEDIRFGKDKVFDSEFASLDQRDDKFIVFYYAYRRAFPNFARLFPEVNSYMDLVYKQGLTPDQKDKVDAITINSINEYPELLINPNKVEINGVCYRQCPDNAIVKSGFEIKSDIATDEKKPLVLPIESGSVYSDIFYVSDNWESTSKAPYYDNRPLDERRLPKANDTYPYLTISDFLEDALIRVPKINANEDAFFCKFANDDSYSYLLPLKPTFFKYFTLQQVQGKVGGKSMIEIEEVLTGHIKVTLRIPIQNNRVIEYTRKYIERGEIRPNENKGILIEKSFAVGLFSNIQYEDEKQAYYRAYIISEFEEKDDYALLFAKGSTTLSVSEPVVRNSSDDRYYSYKTYIIEQQTFDYIRVESDGCSGVLIPIMHKKSGSDKFTFAIDFGTTNSHIEYNINDGTSKPFNVTDKDAILKLWGWVNSFSEKILGYDVIPNNIGTNSLYKFPMRTALCMSSDTNWNKAVYPLGHTNIPFPYEKKSGYDYNRVETDLKWSNDSDNIKRIKSYIESLFLMLRTKVLLNNGNLAKTKIVWFYPISMVENRYNNFSDVWTKAYEKYFGGDRSNVIPMTESVAPYEHYRNSEASVGNIVTIDIGGGTTDIVLANDGEINNITSFHFAANSIFGDPYITNRSSASVNKLLVQYENTIKSVLEDNSLGDLGEILEQNFKSKISDNIASFFFSLKDNTEIQEKRLVDNVDFNTMLQRDTNYKIVFVMFYSAIIYHLAKIMKAKGEVMPRHIAFSGNGSKVIRVLTSSDTTLEKFTKKIFEKVFGQDYPSDGLTILQNVDNPKEVTCKGGLAKPIKQSYEDISTTKIVYKSVNDGKLEFVGKEKYADINDAYLNKVVDEVKTFINFVFELNNDFSFKNNFDSAEPSINIAKEECMRDLLTYTKNGLENKKKEVSDNDVIEETLFFYPLSGMLNALISAIYKKNNSTTR
ncbi:MAG: hypothetical protein U0L77_04125 [Prevotellamassilia sp.]|nr:hypothetical protein [Prevotellamassilia sp.]